VLTRFITCCWFERLVDFFLRRVDVTERPSAVAQRGLDKVRAVDDQELG
jgi:hypothetical protein